MVRHAYVSIELPANTRLGVRDVVVYELPGIREE